MNIENMNLTEELILKAGACKTQEELLALIRENGLTITPEQLPELMAEVAKKCSGELSDDTLEMAGGYGNLGVLPPPKKIDPMGACIRYICKECGAVYRWGHPDPCIHNSTCQKAGSRYCKDCSYAYREHGVLVCGRGPRD